MAIGVGSKIGPFRVSKKLGSGAMGSVFLGSDSDGKQVAIKVIHAELADKPEMVARFFTEARAVNKIGHPNIIEVFDFGQTPSGDNYIVMELLEGITLGERIKLEGTIGLDSTIHVARQICEGLAASHHVGIIHRDLKPDNIFLIDRDGDSEFVKILDFGLAKLTQGGGGAIQIKTQAGSVLGTPHYMAPEQCEGKEVDYRADVYALGCIMFQMLCGRVPFPGDGFGEVLIKHLRETPPMPSKINPEVTPAVEKIILHALAKKKEFRFQSMPEFGRALKDPERFANAFNTLSANTFEANLDDMPMPAPRAAPVQEGGMQLMVSPKADEEQMTLKGSLEDLEAGLLRAVNANQNATPPAPLEAPRPAAPPSVQVKDQAPPSKRPPTGASKPIAAPPLVIAPAAPRPKMLDSSNLFAIDGEEAPPEGRMGGGGRGRGAAEGGSKSTFTFVAIGMMVLGVGAGVAALSMSSGAEASVLVNSDPIGADVIQNGHAVGRTPFVVKVAKAQPASILLRKVGFLDAQQVVKADQKQVDVKLRAVAIVPPPPVTDTDEPPPPKNDEPAPSRPARRPSQPAHRKLPTLPRPPPT